MHSWQWHHWEGLPYLTCSILEPCHGFFTRQFSPRSPQELTQILQPQAEVYRVKQVHGNLVLTPSKVGSQQGDKEDKKDNLEFPSADGLVTEQPEQAVWVASADCTPVLIADAKNSQVAAVHAGWRGTGMKIVPQAIACMLSQGSQIQDLRFALGPAIAGSVYQVSTQVAALVGASILPEQETEAMIDSLQQLPESPLLPDSHPERVRLDIRRVIALQLEQLGISTEQVAIAPHCTYQETEFFFSYRRDKIKQVQWSGIVSSNLS